MENQQNLYETQEQVRKRNTDRQFYTSTREKFFNLILIVSPSCLSINLIRRHLHVNVSHSKPHIFQRQRLKRLLLYNVHSDYIFLAKADWQKAGWATQRREGTRADMCRFNLNFSY